MQAFVWILILGWVFLMGLEWVPKRYRVSQFDDAMTEAAENAGQRGTSSKKLKGGLLWEAQQLDLPITAENLTVVANTSFVRIKTDYILPLNFPGYTYDWHVRREIRRKVFRF